MKWLYSAYMSILLIWLSPTVYAYACPHCIDWNAKIGSRLQQIWYSGNTDILFSGYAWHNRYKYTAYMLAKGHYNELALGGGFAKELWDEDHDFHALYSMAFLDSHKNVEPVIGYAFLKMLNITEKVNIGGGFSILATMRPDIFGGYPFPGAVPLFGIASGPVALFAAYVPGRENIGNVLFIFGKYTL